MPNETLPPRDRIVATALRLFNEQGTLTTGIDQIIAESGVAKRTFYHHFPSKAALLAEFLQRRDAIWRARVARHTGDAAQPPLDRVLGLFDALKEWFNEPDFFGCSFIRGLADFGASPEPKLLAFVQEHFAHNAAHLAALLQEVRPRDHEAFVPQIASLLCGATVMAHVTHDPGIAEVTKEMARTLLTRPAGG